MVEAAETRGVGILGLGTYLPPMVRTNEYWHASLLGGLDDKRRRDIFSVDKTTRGQRAEMAPEIAEAMAQIASDPFRGARLRHVIPDGVEPSDMEAEAARSALSDAGIGPDEIDLLLVASHPQDRIIPSNGPALQAKCALRNAVAFSLEVSCASFVAQLITATGLIRAGMYRHALLVDSSALSRVLDYSSPASTHFGDAAAAAVVGAVKADHGLLSHHSRTEGSLREGVVFAPVSDGRPQVDWTKPCGPVLMTALEPEAGKQAGLQATAFCRDACTPALAAAGVDIADIRLFLCSQSTGWFVDACRRGLGLPAEKCFETFAEVASIGAATVPFNLHRAHRAGLLADGDLVLIYTPGAGLTRSAVVYRWIAPRSGQILPG